MAFFNNTYTLDEAVEGKVIYVLGIVCLLQTIYPITANAAPLAQLSYFVMYVMLMFSGILVARESPRYMFALAVLGVIWLIFSVAYVLYPTITWIFVSGLLVVSVFQAVVIRVLLQYIFITRHVTRDVLYAAIAVYIMLGAIFGGLFGLMEAFTFGQSGQHAFVDGTLGIEGMITPWQSTLYYSYITLTTLGYGDILPVTMWARSLATVEAVIGVLYITIIMARLVGVYVSDHERQSSRKEQTDEN